MWWTPTGKRKKGRLKEHLAKDSNDGAEGDWSLVGQNSGKSTRPGSVAVYDCSLMPSLG